METHKVIFWAAPAVVAAFLLVPLWAVALPAMSDLPAHVSALHVLIHADDPHLSQYYQTEWDFVPDLASEIVVPVLVQGLPFFISVKLFISLALVLWVAAPVAVQYALYRNIGAGALAGGLFTYNAAFTWGFLNFYFAAGLALVLFAAWIASEGRAGAGRTIAFALAGLLLLFAHALGFFLFSLLILSYEAMPRANEGSNAHVRRLAGAAGALLPAALVFLFLRPHAADVHMFSFRILESMPGRLESAMQNRFDTAAYAPLLVLLLLVATGFWKGWVSLHRQMGAVLGALAIFCFFAPSMAGGGWGLHIRFPAVLFLLFFAALEVKHFPRRDWALAALLVGLAGFNAFTLYGSWKKTDRQYAEFRSAMPLVPEGSKLFLAADRMAMGNTDIHPYRHMAEYAIVDRNAFVPLMFTTRGQHVVHTREAYLPISSQTSMQGHEAHLANLADFARNDFRADEDLRYLANWPCTYDQVVVIHMGHPQVPAPKQLHLLRSFSFFSLYDVRHPSNCAALVDGRVRGG